MELLLVIINYYSVSNYCHKELHLDIAGVLDQPLYKGAFGTFANVTRANENGCLNECGNIDNKMPDRITGCLI